MGPSEPQQKDMEQHGGDKRPLEMLSLVCASNSLTYIYFATCLPWTSSFSTTSLDNNFQSPIHNDSRKTNSELHPSQCFPSPLSLPAAWLSPVYVFDHN